MIAKCRWSKPVFISRYTYKGYIKDKGDHLLLPTDLYMLKLAVVESLSDKSERGAIIPLFFNRYSYDKKTMHGLEIRDLVLPQSFEGKGIDEGTIVYVFVKYSNVKDAKIVRGILPVKIYVTPSDNITQSMLKALNAYKNRFK